MNGTEEDLIWGITPVAAALEEADRVHKLLVVEGRRSERLEALVHAARDAGVPITFHPRDALDRLTGGSTHQGVAARLAPVAYEEPHDLLTVARAAGETPLIVALDHLQDPHNLGAVARSAEALGAHGLLVPRHRSAAPGGGAEKAAAGALQRLPIARVANLARALEALKADGLWIVGSAAEEGSPPWRIDLTTPTVLVVGGEEKGVRPVVRKVCDQMAAIPLTGRTASLNASVAAGILLYETARQRAAAGG